MTRVADRYLHGAAAIAVLLALSSVAWRIEARKPLPEYRAGEILQNIPGTSFGDGKTLLIWVDSRCAACAASLPFYRRLSESKHPARVIVVGREPRDEIQTFLSGVSLPPDRFVSVERGALKFRFSPTILLLAPNRAIERVWTGRLETREDENELIDLLREPQP